MLKGADDEQSDRPAERCLGVLGIVTGRFGGGARGAGRVAGPAGMPGLPTADDRRAGPALDGAPKALCPGGAELINLLAWRAAGDRLTGRRQSRPVSKRSRFGIINAAQ